MNVGDWVEIIEGDFQSFEAMVEEIDTETKLVRLKISIFGRACALEFPVDDFERRCVRFSELPVVPIALSADSYRDDLLELCPGAEVVFSTSYESTNRDFGQVYVFRRGSECRGIVNYSNLTWPLTASGCRHAISDRVLPIAHWDKLIGMIDQIDFWQLAYDDGQRTPPAPERISKQLLAYDHGRFHMVKRTNLNGADPIGPICRYLNRICSEG